MLLLLQRSCLLPIRNASGQLWRTGPEHLTAIRRKPRARIRRNDSDIGSGRCNPLPASDLRRALSAEKSFRDLNAEAQGCITSKSPLSGLFITDCNTITCILQWSGGELYCYSTAKHRTARDTFLRACSRNRPRILLPARSARGGARAGRAESSAQPGINSVDECHAMRAPRRGPRVRSFLCAFHDETRRSQQASGGAPRRGGRRPQAGARSDSIVPADSVRSPCRTARRGAASAVIAGSVWSSRRKVEKKTRNMP